MIQRAIVFILLFLTSSGMSQTGNWTLTLKNGDQVTEGIPYKVDQGALILIQDGPFIIIPIADIAQLRIDEEAFKRTYRTVLKWGVFGVMAGGFTSIVIGSISRANRSYPAPSQQGDLVGSDFDLGSEFDAIAGGVFGGLVGLIVGGVVYKMPPPGDKVFPFEALSDKQKLKLLRGLLK